MMLGNGQAKAIPALLVSYAYYKLAGFVRYQSKIRYRDWVLDSGAFTAKHSGVEVDLQEYIDFCKEVRDRDQTLTEIYSLDVIGDWRGTVRNTEEMWRQGIEAIPTFHYGEPWDVLRGFAKDYPKIAVGGITATRGKMRLQWLHQCFARVWPKKVHGFGVGQRNCILGVPMHSTDTSSWEQGPCSFGQWKSYGSQKMSVRGGDQRLHTEIDYYLELEELARHRWKREMEELESPDELALRLAVASVRTGRLLAKKEDDDDGHGTGNTTQRRD